MFEDSIFDDDFSEAQDQEKMSKNWETGFEIGLKDFHKNYRCRWSHGSDFADAYFLGYMYGSMSESS